MSFERRIPTSWTRKTWKKVTSRLPFVQRRCDTLTSCRSGACFGSEALPSITQFALGDLLELLAMHAPSFRHLKLKDYGDVYKFPFGRDLSPWPIVSGIAELELVATPPKERSKLVLVEVSSLCRKGRSRELH